MNDATVFALPVLHSPLLRGAAGIGHGFFTRVGGVSTAPYDSLNTSHGSGDERPRIDENRRRVAADFGLAADRLVTLRQVHGAAVVAVANTPPAADTPGDALVTTTPGMLLGVTTADCVPVLLADPDHGVVGVAHAGWRGAAAGVVEAAVNAMRAAGAGTGSLRAALGPAIAQSAYEVGEEVREQVHEAVPFDTDFLFRSEGDRYRFDLPGLVRALCLQAGVSLVDNLGMDTYAEPGQFFSYRRATHAGESDYGRQLSVIGLFPR